MLKSITNKTGFKGSGSEAVNRPMCTLKLRKIIKKESNLTLKNENQVDELDV